MATKLTKKQKGFVKDYIRTGIGEIAAAKNYDIKVKDNGNTARAIASENLTKPNIVKTIAEAFPDDLLAEKHLELLNATGIDHMVFPVEITDDEIKEFLLEANCKVKRIMHSETQTHIWFFAIDNNARKNALEMAYKIKGTYAPDKSLNVNLNLDDGLTVEDKIKLRELLNANNTSTGKDDVGGEEGKDIPGK